MVFLLIFALIVISICVVSVWPRVGRLPAAAQPWRATLLELQVAREMADVDPPEDDPASPEGVLADRLIAGEITPHAYAEAMARLVAADR